MRVTRLEIFGFKSFRDRFVLNFDKDVIGIVGPNGCGKSNIVDALRWVLGETHARHLRGDLLEDLIFNGSESHRPMGMAEVSITIRPGESWRLGDAVEEMFGSARVAAGEARSDHADSSSEHSDGEADDGSYEEGEDEQGEEQEEEEGTSEAAADRDTSDRNGAGRTPTEQLIPTSLLEIPGLFEAAEIQLTRRLYRSGESEFFINRVPCRLRDMVELYRLIGLGARGLSVVQQGQIGEIISRKPTEVRELLEEAAGISGFRARIETAQRKLEETAENVARLTDIIAEVDKQVRHLRRQAQRAKSRNELKASLAEFDRVVFETKAARIMLQKRDDTARFNLMEATVGQLRGELQHLDAIEGEKRGELERYEVDLIAERARIEEISSRLNAERAKENALQVELAQVESALAAGLKELTTLKSQIEATLEGKQSAEVNLRQSERELAAAENVRREAEQRLVAVQAEAARSSDAGPLHGDLSEVSALTEQVARIPVLGGEIEHGRNAVEQLRARASRLREAVQERQITLSAVDSESRTLSAQLASMAAAMQSKEAADGIRADGVIGDGIGVDQDSDHQHAEVLLAGLTVPPELELAVSAVLGSRGRFLLTDDLLGSALRYCERCEDSGARIECGVIQRDSQPVIGPVELSAAMLEAAPSATRLLDRIGLRPGFESATRAVLGHVVLVESVSEGIALIGQLRGDRPEVVAVTSDGVVVTSWGWFAGDAGVLGVSFNHRIAELRSQRGEIEREINEYLSQQQDLERELQQAEERLKASFVEREGLLRSQRELAVIFQARESQERADRDRALKTERESQDAVRRASAEEVRVRGRVEFETQRVNELTELHARQLQRVPELEQDQHELEAKLTGLRAKTAMAQLDEGAPGAGAIQTVRHELEREFFELEGRIKSLDSARNGVRTALAETSQRLSEVRRKIDQYGDEESATKLSLERAEIELTMLLDEMRRNYGAECDLPNEQQLNAVISQGELEEQLGSAQQQAAELRRRLEREGEVDPESILQFEIEQDRLEKLRAQLEDLTAATKTLERTIRFLKENSRRRFLETFESVSHKFSELVPQLFGGGSGKMELINPEDPLLSGVQLAVRPPGKNLRTLDLLSGGEKALTATAMVVAMFLHRPSPICVLDEVDAPLDDANLDRFLTLIRNIAEKTQFLVITHNKLTMAASDRLVGITMQEKGISTALSVTFEEAEREVQQWAANG